MLYVNMKIAPAVVPQMAAGVSSPLVLETVGPSWEPSWEPVKPNSQRSNQF